MAQGGTCGFLVSALSAGLVASFMQTSVLATIQGYQGKLCMQLVLQL